MLHALPFEVGSACRNADRGGARLRRVAAAVLRAQRRARAARRPGAMAKIWHSGDGGTGQSESEGRDGRRNGRAGRGSRGLFPAVGSALRHRPPPPGRESRSPRASPPRRSLVLTRRQPGRPLPPRTRRRATTIAPSSRSGSAVGRASYRRTLDHLHMTWGLRLGRQPSAGLRIVTDFAGPEHRFRRTAGIDRSPPPGRSAAA